MNVIKWLLLSILMSGGIQAQNLGAEATLTLYQIMKDVHEVCQKNNLEYWVHAGTLLGAVRHGGLIPWDDDLDIVIKVGDRQNFLKAMIELEQLGYHQELMTDMGYKICTTLSDGSLIWCDVMLFVEYDDKTSWGYRLSPGMHKGVLPFFNTSELYPLKKYIFGEIEVMGPQNSVPYLDRVYPNWRHVAAMWSHTTDFSQPIPQVQLSHDLMNPAQPTGPLEDRIFCDTKKVLDIEIRLVELSDVERLTELLGQLGFPQHSTEMCEAKIGSFLRHEEDQLWVATKNGYTVGFLALNVITPFYYCAKFARVDAIVVDEQYRDFGIGGLLMKTAEHYALSIGCQRVFLTSGNHRPKAHDFYKHLGYVSNATYFVKYLDSVKKCVLNEC